MKDQSAQNADTKVAVMMKNPSYKGEHQFPRWQADHVLGHTQTGGSRRSNAALSVTVIHRDRSSRRIRYAP